MTKDQRENLDKAWGERNRLRAEGQLLITKGSGVFAAGSRLKSLSGGDKLHVEGHRMRAEGDRIINDGSCIRTLGDTLWVNALLQELGNVLMEWVAGDCKVDGEEFKV